MAVEEIDYAIVWEEEKEASNVIDYNVREEQTKDTFAEENANNQTTTGMANVIPWVNAPKLVWDTSVYWGGWWAIPLSDLVVQWTTDYEWAKKVLDYVLAWKTFVVLYKIGSSRLVRHLDYINNTSWYIRFYRVYDQTNYLRIDYNTTTLEVTSITEAH
jgi:hypothetical protein